MDSFMMHLLRFMLFLMAGGLVTLLLSFVWDVILDSGRAFKNPGKLFNSGHTPNPPWGERAIQPHVRPPDHQAQAIQDLARNIDAAVAQRNAFAGARVGQALNGAGRALNIQQDQPDRFQPVVQHDVAYDGAIDQGYKPYSGVGPKNFIEQGVNGCCAATTISGFMADNVGQDVLNGIKLGVEQKIEECKYRGISTIIATTNEQQFKAAGILKECGFETVGGALRINGNQGGGGHDDSIVTTWLYRMVKES